MGKKRSKGVSILGAWLLVSGTFGILRTLRADLTAAGLSSVLMNVVWLGVTVACGMGLIFLKEWARRLTMMMEGLKTVLTVLFVLRMNDELWRALLESARVTTNEVPRNVLSMTVIVLSICWCALICFFLTRPAVKEQFKNDLIQ